MDHAPVYSVLGMSVAGGMAGALLQGGEPRLLELLSGLMVLMGIASYVALRWIQAPYGRYASAAFGFPVPARLAWFLQELPSLCIPIALLLYSSRTPPLPQLLLLGAFIAHYVQRTLVFPFLIRGGKPTPFVTFVLAFVFCVYNGYLQGRYLCTYADYSPDWATEPFFIIGMSVWLLGLVINIHSDHILRNLRKPGGLFEHVTGANFFGEIVEWAGFAVASWSTESAAFAIFTFLVLSSRAQQHHQWYLDKFEDYPKSRKMLIPFLY
ncbi:3-oxo-5-alpha-steroid 4-dehydrogenase 1 isoform X2 [Ambystoma mexicanum]|uniref:3-oxo-5-alpha-steroid 4-dehydrogenase 1 isoform X2 n=1 Tax=Ambystoma mexicanum TaxID=8296 RepID=UPI0037E87354